MKDKAGFLFIIDQRKLYHYQRKRVSSMLAIERGIEGNGECQPISLQKQSSRGGENAGNRGEGSVGKDRQLLEEMLSIPDDLRKAETAESIGMIDQIKEVILVTQVMGDLKEVAAKKETVEKCLKKFGELVKQQEPDGSSHELTVKVREVNKAVETLEIALEQEVSTLDPGDGDHARLSVTLVALERWKNWRCDKIKEKIGKYLILEAQARIQARVQEINQNCKQMELEGKKNSKNSE